MNNKKGLSEVFKEKKYLWKQDIQKYHSKKVSVLKISFSANEFYQISMIIRSPYA